MILGARPDRGSRVGWSSQWRVVLARRNRLCAVTIRSHGVTSERRPGRAARQGLPDGLGGPTATQGAATRHIAQVVAACERVAAGNLDRRMIDQPLPVNANADTTSEESISHADLEPDDAAGRDGRADARARPLRSLQDDCSTCVTVLGFAAPFSLAGGSEPERLARACTKVEITECRMASVAVVDAQ